MIIEHLKFLQKYLVKYHGRAIGVGDTISEALGQALLQVNQNKYIWKTK
jgi:hypothetical protein